MKWNAVTSLSSLMKSTTRALINVLQLFSEIIAIVFAWSGSQACEQKVPFIGWFRYDCCKSDWKNASPRFNCKSFLYLGETHEEKSFFEMIMDQRIL